MDIESYAPRSGRVIQEDGSVVNDGDLLTAISGALADILAAGNITLLAVKQGAQDATAEPWLTDAVKLGALTNRSGTIAAADTSQQLAAPNATRRYLFVQNVHASEDLWINFTADAALSQPSIQIKAGGSFVMEGSFVSTEKVTVIAHTETHPFTAKEG